MKRTLALLIGASLAFGILTAVPAALLWGNAMYADAAVAGGLSVLPTVLALVGAERARQQSPQLQTVAVLGGSGLRMMVALGVGVLLYSNVPYFAEQGLFAFWGWLLVFYLFTLGLEIALLVGRGGRSDTRQSAEG